VGVFEGDRRGGVKVIVGRGVLVPGNVEVSVGDCDTRTELGVILGWILGKMDVHATRSSKIENKKIGYILARISESGRNAS
jgi:hypothetical protein